jgi:hypothetical protein
MVTGAGGGWVDRARQEEPSCLQALTGADSSRCRVGGNTSRNAHDYGGEEATDLRRDRRRLPAEARRAAVLRARKSLSRRFGVVDESALRRPSSFLCARPLRLGWTPRALGAGRDFNGDSVGRLRGESNGLLAGLSLWEAAGSSYGDAIVWTPRLQVASGRGCRFSARSSPRSFHRTVSNRRSTASRRAGVAGLPASHEISTFLYHPFDVFP